MVPATPELVVLLSLAVAAGVYARGWARLRRRMPRRFGWRQLLCFLAGLDVIAVAIAPPLHALADRSLLAHMVQHMLIMLVAPPLIWLGAPLAPLLRGLPAGAARGLIAALAWRPLRPAGRALTHPASCWVAFAAAAWAWHVPALYELALRSHGWHHAEHASFLVAGLLFWWPVVQPWPSRRRWPRWAMVPYLLAAEVHNTVLAAIFTLSGRAIYPTYAASQGDAAALRDQVAAGIVMWGPGSLVFLLPAGLIAVHLLGPGPGAREEPGVPVLPAL
jgi:cytochrome c oxidase assembly factor CtaG